MRIFSVLRIPNVMIMVFLLFLFVAKGDGDTTYFDADWKKTISSKAEYYRVFNELAPNKWCIEDYHKKNNQIKLSGHFTSHSMELKDGLFVFYYENGNKERACSYKSNMLEGAFTNYYDNGSVQDEGRFADGLTEGRFVAYYRNGNVSNVGSYVAGMLNGQWKQYYEDIKEVWVVRTYDNGVLTQLTSYYPGGKLKRIEKYQDLEAFGKCYNEKGDEIAFTPFSTKPSPSFLIQEYLQNNLQYPVEARSRNVEGKVIVQFAVNEDGSIGEVKLMKGIGWGCDEEAIRVVSKMPLWEPGALDDKKIKIYLSQPISFKLTK